MTRLRLATLVALAVAASTMTTARADLLDPLDVPDLPDLRQLLDQVPGARSGAEPADPGVAPEAPVLGALPGVVDLLEGEVADLGGGDLPTVPELPVLHSELERGTLVVTGRSAGPVAAKTVDGSPDDWVGDSPRLAGTVVLSDGELIYMDHLGDAHGADDGGDAARLALLDPLAEAVPETYRVDPVFQADVLGQLGFPTPDALTAEEHYGSAGHQAAADLVEVRLATGPVDAHPGKGPRPRPPRPADVHLLARTLVMTHPEQTAVLVLADTRDGTGDLAVPFNSGIRTRSADVAVLLAGESGWLADLVTGTTTTLEPGSVATDPVGYTNAIEARLPRAILARPDGTVRLAVAAGLFDAENRVLAALDGVGANLANVAFRTAEPVRTWMDKHQALTLGAGTIDPFLLEVDLADLDGGTTESVRPGPGYHERIFTSSPDISDERGLEGIHQHYGLYLPTAYDGETRLPAQWWLHWRGGKAHSAAALSPRIMRDMGEARDGIVISPRGRGTSTWYLGRGMVDVLEVWDDVMTGFAIDADRVYVSGHSMGGWGSYLLPILMPDRFAATLPVAAPVTQGAWTGLDLDGCDDLRFEEYTPCYVATNDSDPRTQHTRRLLENLRNVPVGIYQGAADELVPVTGVTRQVERLVELGYRHRYYLFPTYEHYTHPIVDEWAEGVRYLDRFRRDANPRRVTFIRDMPFEHTVRNGPSVSNPAGIDWLRFDRAYWMSDLTPADDEQGVARFDGHAFAIARAPHLALPEVGGPASVGQIGPYSMTGLRWVTNPFARASSANAFAVQLDGATSVRLDLDRMAIDLAAPVTGDVTTEHPLEVRLAGPWTAPPTVTSEGTLLPTSLADGVLTVAVPAGRTTLSIEP